jgi:hypothetical protein
MLIEPSILAFITTYRCTSECDHCCFSCSPRKTERISYEKMIGMIDEASGIASIRMVTFTGGECFLLGDELDRLIAHASGKKLRTRCVSNGYWATSMDVARKRIKKLVDSGLDEINFSTGGMHANFIPVENVARATRASVDAGLCTALNIETFNESTFDIRSFMEHPLLADLVRDKKILINQSPWIMTKGSKKITNSPDRSRFIQSNKSGCHTCLNVIAVTPDLELVACCGFSIKQIPSLTLGSVKEDPLDLVLSKVPDDFLKIWLHIEGPERILDFVKRHVPDYRLPVEAVHPCETCNHLYHDETARAVIREHYREVEERIMDMYFIDLATKSTRAYEKCTA